MRAVMIVSESEVTRNATATTQVSLPRAVAALRPDIAFPPPPMPRPPPSDRCRRTIPISTSARIRCMVSATLLIVRLAKLEWRPGRVGWLLVAYGTSRNTESKTVIGSLPASRARDLLQAATSKRGKSGVQHHSVEHETGASLNSQTWPPDFELRPTWIEQQRRNSG